jgi:nitroreductase
MMLQNIEHLIRSRKSVRTYNSKAIEPEKKKMLVDFMNDHSIGIFGNKTDFFWIDADAGEFKNVKLGTYGVISGTKYFIAGKIKPSEKNFEDFGYCMEQFMLFCTQLNIGTCWLGGTYKKTAFSTAIDLKPEEIIPAVTPLGYFDGKKSMIDKLFRYGAGSDNRKTFDELFFSNTFSQKLSEDERSRFDFCLEMLRHAPSASNKQPWRLVLKDNVFHFFLKRTANYNNMIKHSDLQRIDMGIAISHFEMSLSEKNIAHRWYVEDPKLELENLTEYVASCEVK